MNLELIVLKLNGKKIMLNECDEEGLKDLLVGHKITQVVDSTLTLDDGTSLYFVGNEGCGGCSSGWYDLKKT